MHVTTHPLLDMGMNLGISTPTQIEAREIIVARMKARGHVAAKLQQFTLR